MRSDKPNLIVDLTFDFALKIISFTESLQEKKKYNMANQLFRSGTSIGANVREAQNAQSKSDFIHKMKIVTKDQMKHSIGYPFEKNRKTTPIRAH